MIDKDELQEILDKAMYDLNHVRGMLSNAQTQCNFLTSANQKLQRRLDNQIQINTVLIDQRRVS